MSFTKLSQTAVGIWLCDVNQSLFISSDYRPKGGKDTVLYVLGLFCRSLWKGHLYLQPVSVILEADGNILHSPVGI